eukprot:TRINITY_DN50981_c0_g1_i1.p1 TRINITY_DN50981_c0_g1~~TRINITY_DN50981_c0_g1_i1.p1  ORF type:complete len:489 (+),score=151.24 TRINITY_DN50981_c0_g1_i1:73-1539(+)
MGLKSPLRRLFHWGPIITLALIFGIAAVTVICCFTARPGRPPVSYAEQTCFLCETAMILLSYLVALAAGPGTPPQGWRPSAAEVAEWVDVGQLPALGEVSADDVLQYCKQCKAYKPPRAHHCSACNVCVMKMDHHCPWINSCVGHKNHKAFWLFTHYVPITTLHSAWLLTDVLYEFWVLIWYRRKLRHLRYPIELVAVGAWAWIASLAVAIAVGTVAWQQSQAVHGNMTQVEDAVTCKAQSRRQRTGEAPFVYPYDLGPRLNWAQVFGSWWLFPVPTLSPGTGLRYQLRKGCGPYDFTQEQLAQKAEKRLRERHVQCSAPYRSRYRHMLRHICSVAGVRLLCKCPAPDEPDLAVSPGDKVAVSRSRRGWLYGRLLPADGAAADPAAEEYAPRGWLPRSCVHFVDMPTEPWLEPSQGSWVTSTPAGKEVTVTISGASVSVPGQLAPLVLRPMPEGEVALLGRRLLRAADDVLEWEGGAEWRRPTADSRD